MNVKQINYWILINLSILSTNIEENNFLTGPSHDKVVVCYLGSWAVYRPGRGAFAIENIDPSLCTHLIYSFAGLDAKQDSIRVLGKKYLIYS